MKRSLLLFLALLWQSFNAFAQPSPQWVKSITTNQSSYNGVEIRQMAFDQNGAMFLTGIIVSSSIYDFDPSPATATLGTNGSYDYFLAKYDSLGNYMWSFNIGGTGMDEAYSLALDATGNVYLTGYFFDKVDFDPSPSTYTLSNFNDDIFIAKYDNNGNFQWAKQLGGSIMNDWDAEGRKIVITPANNLLITGYVRGEVDFDPSPATYTINVSAKEPFIAEYDLNGNFLWARDLRLSASASSGFGNDLEVDNSGNIYLTGHFNMTMNFDLGVSNYTLTAGSTYSTDVFIAKYSPTGTFIWARQIGAAQRDEAYELALDPSNNIWVGGIFINSVDFDPSANTALLATSSPTNSDIFLAKYDNNGNYLWAGQLKGNTMSERIRDLKTDANGNIYVSGNFDDSLDIDPSASTLNFNTTGQHDGFIAKYSMGGSYQWGFKIGSANTESVTALHLRGNGLYCAGNFGNNADFDPSAATLTAVCGNTTSVAGFIAKYNLSGSTSVPESYTQKELLLFPNPAKDKLQLISEENIDEVTLYDILGKNFKNLKAVNQNMLEMNISDLNPGIYFLRIRSGGVESTAKFVKE
jgi:uncharacterized protein (DUF2249 family)